MINRRIIAWYFQKCVTTSKEIKNATQINICPQLETRLDERTIEIPVFLFFTWARNNRPVCGKQFIPKHDSTNTQAYHGEMWYQCTRAHHISDLDPCSLGVIADARVTKAAHHTPESANQICFPPSCSVLPSHTPAHWLHRCVRTLWHPENMHALGACAEVKLSWSWVMAAVRFALNSRFWTVLIWCAWCTFKA
jgi:hypothetical protein